VFAKMITSMLDEFPSQQVDIVKSVSVVAEGRIPDNFGTIDK